MPEFLDLDGNPLAKGDRIIPTGWGGDVPLYLSSSKATIVGFGRTRIRVQFDGAVYGGRFPEYDAINPRVVKKVTA